ncbi:MAG: hypothetical protein ACI84C_000255 [Flavobacteriales bacterium]|jgi:hypothetical protein
MDLLNNLLCSLISFHDIVGIGQELFFALLNKGLALLDDGAHAVGNVLADVNTKSERIGILRMRWYDLDNLSELAIRFGINLFFAILLVRYIYYPIAKRKDFLFTYIAINVSIFLLCFILEIVKLELGFALGLFAIFGIIRYRTDPIPIKEMTYLFVVIALSVLNALVNKEISLAQMIFANIAIIGVTFALEKLWLLRHESQKVIVYEKIELIKPDRRAELIEDIEERTGIKITRLEIGKIDFLRDTAQVFIFFYDDEQLGMADDRQRPAYDPD